MPRIFGITGTIGSGKSTLADLFIQKKWYSIDVDAIGKVILQQESTKHILSEQFGQNILSKNGDIIPSELGKIVFNNPTALIFLNQYMHPKMKKHIQNILETTKNESIIIHAALLFQMELDSLCNLVINIDVEETILIERILSRKSYLDLENIKNLIEKQKKDNNFIKFSDIILDNSSGLKELQDKFERLYSQLKEESYEPR